jgi:uncharacterized damage-inducible protein DinB
MSSSAMLSALFGFNQAMNERLWTIIMEHLTEAQFAQPDGYSRGSIRNQLIHMAEAQYYWLRGLLDVQGFPELNAEVYPTRAAARTICQQADQEILNRVRGLSEADLERIPDRWSQPVWVGLLQNANHSTDHRAQILRALHDLGAPTFDQNFSDYMENATPMTVEGLIGQIGTKRAEWDDLLRQVAAEDMDQPLLNAWRVRDAIALITWKERRLIEIIQTRVFTGVSFGELPEAEQANILEASRAMPLPALIEQHQVTHHEMLEALRTLTDDDVNSERVDGLPPDVRFWKVIAVASWWSYPSFSIPLQQLLQMI